MGEKGNTVNFTMGARQKSKKIGKKGTRKIGEQGNLAKFCKKARD